MDMARSSIRLLTTPRHICLVTGAHLCRNPRVVKEATALGEAGYHVDVVAPLISDHLMEEDHTILEGAPFRRVVSVHLRSSRRFTGLLERGVRRTASELNRRLRLERPEELGYGIQSALRKARALDADYYIGHQESGAWVVWKLMKEGYRVGADLEDWYSRDLLPQARAGRPVKLLDRIEGDLVRNARHCTTTSEAMACAMERAYGKRPNVIYNSFPWAEREQIDGLRKDRLDDDRPSLFWFSQTIGPGRGLELLIDALCLLEQPVQLHLRGNLVAEYDKQLLSRLGPSSSHSVRFHSLVSPFELLSRIAEHHIGLALEQSTPPNRDLTITNKILQYLQGGLAVVATDTAGQREVAGTAGKAVTVVAGTTVEDLRRAIESLISDHERLDQARASALEAASGTLAWETQAVHLVELVDQSLAAHS